MSNLRLLLRTSVLATAVVLIPVSYADAQIPPIERDALIALYNSTDGANWTGNTGWLGAVGTECTWYGVLCSEGRVQYLLLDNNQLNGSIPPELGNLSSMVRLNLFANQLSGGIPLELGNLSSLQELYLGVNQLSGNIPSELGNLSSLGRLWLPDNQLSGSIPPALGNLTGLQWLSLYNNQLSGSIPPELGELSSLEILGLFNNHLSGSIPPELGELSSITILNLNSNRLSGSIPSELGNLSILGELYLSSNRLSGSIPPELGDLSTLKSLGLSYNRLGGSIPPELGNLTGLWPNSLGLGYNALWTDDATLRAFLDLKDPDWAETQTIAPEGLTVTSVADRTVWLEWTPITYTDDSGGYEVFFKEETGETVSGGYTLNKTASIFPVTGLQPGQTFDFAVATFTRPHSYNQNTVVSDQSGPVTATTSDTGCATPIVTVSGDPVPYTLTVTSTHDSYEWSTGETTTSITVTPLWASWYWVKTTGPGSCEEAAVAFAPVLFNDGFESGDTSAWSSKVP